jgi:hypothetical protein
VRLRFLPLGATLSLLVAQPLQADVVGQWTTEFGQGIIEYSIYNDFQQSTYITISDGSNGVGATVQIFLAINGKGARPGTPVTFSIGSTAIRMWADAGGSISTGCQQCARDFDTLWRLLRSGNQLKLAFDGREAIFTLRGAARVLPRTPPPADFYR